MTFDQGLYEERYRLAGSIAASLALSLVMIGVAVHFSYGTWMALAALAFLSITVPCLAAAASGRIAFRADVLGITLGASPLSLPGRDSSPVFIPWSDVERIVLYSGPKSGELGAGDRQCIGIQRRPGAPRLPRGNRPARRCPVPGLAEGETRQVVAWRLDRERLTTLTAAVAPCIPVIVADPDVEGPAIDGPALEDTALGDPALEGLEPG